MEKILIIGGVAAGATAAAKTRRLSPDAQITMLEAGPDVSFANCGLPYYIAGDIKSRSSLILQSPESFKDQYDVDVYTNTTVTAIEPDNHILKAEDSITGEKSEYEYTKLILAQGGKPIKPELPGADRDHVFTLWTLGNMDAITDYLDNEAPKTAVVVGGGFIGLEMVEALTKRGLEVSVVEKMPHVMSIMEAETAGFIEREMKEFGVGVYTNAGVAAINDGDVSLEDGRKIKADMVILSIGVRPTLQLAIDAGLRVGEAGGLLVDEYLQTSHPDIYAGGDMVELEHRVHGKKVRIPLAGPANRQGRIAAENALGGKHSYKGAIGTSVVRVFEAVAGTTGLNLSQARAMGFDAEVVVAHKEHHTSYYPGAETVSVLIVFDKKTGRVLGGQTAGYKGADKRLDVIATATAAKLTVHELSDIDLAYSPPIGTPNDAVNMAAYAAENKMSGFSPSVTAAELENFIQGKKVAVLDVRDVFSFQKSSIKGAAHIPLELLSEHIKDIPKDVDIIVYDETGKKGHQALRTLVGAGCKSVTNITGGHTSLQRFAITGGFEFIEIDILPLEKKSINEEAVASEEKEEVEVPVEENARMIIDVRSAGEFASGAVPTAINISLDDIMQGSGELGEDLEREIYVYCASGARSAYAQQVLAQRGYTNVTNGGGVSQMMSWYSQQEASAPQEEKTEKNTTMIVDVRSEGEFRSGAVPNAVNITLDDIMSGKGDLGDNKEREIIVYCASGARSAYAQQVLTQQGYTSVKNGGGVAMMMSRYA
ncbi:MAG: FAD-dependent oxidoreductase [Bacteroidales bacterium]|jgi:NADPH-dependent 2,4-dienoyl-CoA reductase/sulfur reductase-like enzyme/rhodanese-related sulfurtransferase|nr:FAD-dependent oxidoreductase [Bacteroidales bacterium]